MLFRIGQREIELLAVALRLHFFLCQVEPRALGREARLREVGFGRLFATSKIGFGPRDF